MDEASDPGRYGERWAEVYDEVHGDLPGVEDLVAFVADLAEDGPVLEFGVGTGRLALPLVARGIPVHGIDASQAMLDGLRAKDGGTGVPVTLGDFAETRLPDEFAVVLLAFNTLFNLPTQDAQVRCFTNAAAHLAPGGVFVLEAFVPDPTRFVDGQAVRADAVGADGVTLHIEIHDAAEQRVRSQRLVLDEEGLRLLPVDVRYAWPSELDLMARLAGLRLRHRFGDWSRTPFTAASEHHVSVYERGAPPPAGPQV